MGRLFRSKFLVKSIKIGLNFVRLSVFCDTIMIDALVLVCILAFIFGNDYRHLLYICLLYSLLSVSTADVNTLIACFFLWEYHLKCS